MPSQESAKARKHIAISLQARHIAEECCPGCAVYVATYTTGQAGQAYQRIEEQSGQEFWSIKAWTPPPRRRLKDPDLLITCQDRVRFIVEVKWGALPGCAESDMAIADEEMRKMHALRQGPVLCRVRGPAVRAAARRRSASFPIERDCFTGQETRLVLVTDLAAMKRLLPWTEYTQLLARWKTAEAGAEMADIATRVDAFPSFREILQG
jgi:hypothetical protein